MIFALTFTGNKPNVPSLLGSFDAGRKDADLPPSILSSAIKSRNESQTSKPFGRDSFDSGLPLGFGKSDKSEKPGSIFGKPPPSDNRPTSYGKGPMNPSDMGLPMSFGKSGSDIDLPTSFGKGGVGDDDFDSVGAYGSGRGSALRGGRGGRGGFPDSRGDI